MLVLSIFWKIRKNIKSKSHIYTYLNRLIQGKRVREIKKQVRGRVRRKKLENYILRFDLILCK